MPILDKRKGDDILALVPASKRTKNEVVFSSREKAVVQSVSNLISHYFYDSMLTISLEKSHLCTYTMIL